MKKRSQRKWKCCTILCILLLFLAVGFGVDTRQAAAASPYKKNGRLSVKKGKIVNKKGRPFVIQGVSTHGLSWFPEYVNKRAFLTLRNQWKVNTIRLALYTAEYNGYCSGGNKKELEQLIDKGVRYATDLGMYVIIDWHILSDGNPLTHKKEAKKFFRKMAKKYKNYGNVMYEICNEPNGGGGSWKNIKKYAKPVIKTIRKVNKKAIVIVGTPTWSQEIDKPQNDPITGYKNVAYSFHFYAGTHKADLRSRLKTAAKNGVPVIVTEFGICDASGNGNMNPKEGNLWMRLLNQYKIGRVCWSLANKAESASLLKSSCKKTGGWRTQDLSASGKWLRQAYTKKKNGVNEDDTLYEDEEENTENPSQETEQEYGEPHVTGQAEKVNSWGSDGDWHNQYKILLRNDGTASAKGWKVVLQMKEAASLENSWNGTFQCSGRTVTIDPADYNQKIEAGGVIEIGCIIISAAPQEILSVEATPLN
ncbi:MAG: cellulase family glycosylhydrolase [Eubacteriales bacterium]|nr:cellulase family glycosylhydrolase [Eubacteriales bacterium]